MHRVERSYETAARRWAGIGPYYAMFPIAFADEVVRQYTVPGDTVLDPFAGRGTSIFSAAAQGRCGIGIEINPVGWVYARAKLRPAEQDAVAAKFSQLEHNSYRYREEAKALPTFFHSCFSPRVLEFLVTARRELDWRRRVVDWTAMALLLVHLHGKRKDSLSNQMRQAKAMSPDYAIRWWQERGFTPPDIDPAEFMSKKLNWRYAKGRPTVSSSCIYLGDSVELLPKVGNRQRARGLAPAHLLFTSPPYFGLTNYHYDQWLRLWLLGSSPNALRIGGRHRGKFEHRERYRSLLLKVFGKAAKLLNSDGVVYVRTDRRKITYQTTLEVLGQVFPGKRLLKKAQPFRRPTQTRLFGDHSVKVGEVDLILLPR